MKTVKILCGGYGLRVPTFAGVRTQLVRMGETCEVEDEEAERLAFLGLAAIVGAEHAELPPEDTGRDGPCGYMPRENDAQGDDQEATLDPEQLSTMTNAQLKQLAEDMGLDVAKCRKKADYISLIAAEPVVPDDDDAVEDGEEPPSLGAEAPVI